MEKPSVATEQLVKLDSILDEYESSIGLPLYSADFHDPSVHKYMQMDRTSVEKLTLEECAEASLLLGGLSFHIQRSHNREIARVQWAETSIKSTTSGRENQYSGSWDSQYHQAIKDNDYTRKLLSIKTIQFVILLFVMCWQQNNKILLFCYLFCGDNKITE